MDIVPTKKFDREAAKKQANVSGARGTDMFDRVVQWLLYKPQIHAVAPFETNQDTRGFNRERR